MPEDALRHADDSTLAQRARLPARVAFVVADGHSKLRKVFAFLITAYNTEKQIHTVVGASVGPTLTWLEPDCGSTYKIWRGCVVMPDEEISFMLSIAVTPFLS